MPKGIYGNIGCSEDGHPKFEPTEHQKETVKYFLSSPYKGLLLYHKLGSGKTCTSILIADAMLKAKKIKKVYIMTPGSLRDGWITEYCKVCGESKNMLSKDYVFITYNYMVGKNLPDFTGCLVIIDEVHNLINGAKNMSLHPTLIYDTLLKSDCKILALSGTPIYNYVYEFALLGNLLKPGGEFPEIRKGKGEIDSFAFMKLFDVGDDGNLKPKNKTVMKRKLDGIISYYPGAGSDFVPEIINEPIIKVKMTNKQEENYWEAQIQEEKFNIPPRPKLKYENPKLYDVLRRLYIMAKKNILTRTASNFFYNEKDIDISKKLLQVEDKDAIEIIQKKPDLPVSSGGWINKDLFKDGELYKIYSTKFTAFITNLILHIGQKHVLFTFFKSKAGVYLLKTILGQCGIRAEIFSGDLDDKQRRSLLKVFNSPKNRYGDVIKVLLVTEAGAEGISVLEARHMHILESSPRMSKTIQAIGRVARYKSHIALPPEERKIRIWKYWSVASEDPVKIETTVYLPDGNIEKSEKIITNKITIDEILHKKGMKIINQVDSFLDLLKKVSATRY
jgi:superfamily II DNA or RNA helicase